MKSGEVVTALASHLFGWGLHHTWVEFVVVSLLFSQKFFPGYSRFIYVIFLLCHLTMTVINFRNPLEYGKKGQRNHEAYPVLYSKPNIFQISIQSGMVCGCATSKSLFYLFVNLCVCVKVKKMR